MRKQTTTLKGLLKTLCTQQPITRKSYRSMPPHLNLHVFVFSIYPKAAVYECNYELHSRFHFPAGAVSVFGWLDKIN